MNPNNSTFDIAGPGRGGISPTARPVVPQPISVNDSMVREVGFASPPRDPDAISVTVNRSTPPTPTVAPVEELAPAIADHNDNALPPAQPISAGQLFQPDTSQPGLAQPPDQPMPDMNSPKPKRRSKLWLWVVLVFAVLAGAYLAVDAKLVGSNINLPYHFFSQKTATKSDSSTSAKSSLPAGFSQYQLNDAKVGFGAPTSWGTPTSSSDPGYSQRGGSLKSDTTHAFLVTFAQNKDVQLALTSSSSLPGSTDNRYFDYLQWCQGTIDQQLYLQRLIFTTTDGVDTPATIVCDQGPLKNAVQIDSTTILTPKSSTSASAANADIYIKNLSGNSSASVLRVVDAAMTNSDDIKLLLSTVQNL